MTLLWGKQSKWCFFLNLTFFNSTLVTEAMTPRAQSYLSYNWPDTPLGSGHIGCTDY